MINCNLEIIIALDGLFNEKKESSLNNQELAWNYLLGLGVTGILK